jgi:hypothetical protein
VVSQASSEIATEQQTRITITEREPTEQISSSVRRSERNNKREPEYYKTLHKKGPDVAKARISNTNLQAIAKPVIAKLMLQAGPCLMALKAEYIINYNPDLPKNYKQARWYPAMKKQFEWLESQNTWDLYAQPKDEKVLPGKWVYDERIDPNNSIQARAQWVVCGNYEEDSWAIQDTYTAVVNATSLRVFIAMAAIKNLEIL